VRSGSSRGNGIDISNDYERVNVDLSLSDRGGGQGFDKVREGKIQRASARAIPDRNVSEISARRPSAREFR